MHELYCLGAPEIGVQFNKYIVQRNICIQKKRQIWTFNADKQNQKKLNLYKIS